MLTRSKRVTLTFRHPFSPKDAARQLAAGTYEVVSDEELDAAHARDLGQTAAS